MVIKLYTEFDTTIELPVDIYFLIEFYFKFDGEFDPTVETNVGTRNLSLFKHNIMTEFDIESSTRVDRVSLRSNFASISV